MANGFGQNCIIFGVDMSSSVHVDNKKKDIPTQGLDGTTLTVDTKYSINFTKNNKVQQTEQIAIYLLMVPKLLNLKQKILKLQQLHYIDETFHKTFLQIIGKRQD